MGCVSSADHGDADNQGHVASPAPQPQSQAEAQGADVAAAAAPPPDAETAKRQRRRLSVAPHHVGDISKAVPAAAHEADRKEETDAEVKAKGQIRSATKSKKGVVPYNRNKVNQDRVLCVFGLGNDPEVSLFAVMDGHGEFGHSVAQFVQENLPVYMAAEAELKTDPYRCMEDAIRKMCDKLAQTSINISFSGTTLVFGVKIGSKLYVGNIGDSRCVLCRQVGDKYEAVPLSTDQKPEHPAEKKRIIDAGGRVEPLPGPPGEDCGPPRVWLKDVDVPGLAMSRSIGDEVSQTVGVISVPEIVEHDLADNDIFAVWASDGVWEFMSNEDVCHLIWMYRNDYKEATNKLVEEAHNRWRREEEVIDDISCVIIGFNSNQ